MKAMTAEDKKIALKDNNRSSRKKRSGKIRDLAILGVLTAIMFIMTFTPVGYLKLPGLSITFMTIPVIISAVMLGPKGAAVIGGMFGITSLIQAITGASALTGALFQLNPVFTCILCIVPRVLEGFLGGLIFSCLKKADKTGFVSYCVTSLSVPLMNTLFFMSTLFLLFYQTDAIQSIAADKGAGNPLTLFVAMAGVNAVIEAVVCFIVGTAITKALSATPSKKKK